eukprot:CAMPEP_0178999170 /NCGR_PEP_ID=MMETSP0795-20121207/9904_1 /TAXON_ID=88552 /ORGANISM="Amoebophrya sp., Strain Ameob2" /LENGTH=820 /DNA_ID=CAMNT_0020691899 /DNA_START=1169 /DNA_END=3631 /DNA_ORIENTATION=+
MGDTNIPYIGNRISLITTHDIRYEGILIQLNQKESTIAVQNVRSFGTEGRKEPEVPMSNEIYDYIVFSGKDLKDLTVIQEDKSTSSETAVSRGGTGFTDSTTNSPRDQERVNLAQQDAPRANQGPSGGNAQSYGAQQAAQQQGQPPAAARQQPPQDNGQWQDQQQNWGQQQQQNPAAAAAGQQSVAPNGMMPPPMPPTQREQQHPSIQQQQQQLSQTQQQQQMPQPAAGHQMQPGYAGSQQPHQMGGQPIGNHHPQQHGYGQMGQQPNSNSYGGGGPSNNNPPGYQNSNLNVQGSVPPLSSQQQPPPSQHPGQHNNYGQNPQMMGPGGNGQMGPGQPQHPGVQQAQGQGQPPMGQAQQPGQMGQTHQPHPGGNSAMPPGDGAAGGPPGQVNNSMQQPTYAPQPHQMNHHQMNSNYMNDYGQHVGGSPNVYNPNTMAGISGSTSPRIANQNRGYMNMGGGGPPGGAPPNANSMQQSRGPMGAAAPGMGGKGLPPGGPGNVPGMMQQQSMMPPGGASNMMGQQQHLHQQQHHPSAGDEYPFAAAHHHAHAAQGKGMPDYGMPPGAGKGGKQYPGGDHFAGGKGGKYSVPGGGALKGAKGGQKSIKDLLMMDRHSKEEAILRNEVSKRGGSAVSVAELRAMSETRMPLYDFFLDVSNYCLPASCVEEPEQWERFARLLQQYFGVVVDYNYAAGSGGATGNSGSGGGSGGQSHQSRNGNGGGGEEEKRTRPALTMADFVITNASENTKKKKKEAVKAAKPVKKPVAKPSDSEKPASVASEWVCPRCTLRNQVGDWTCKACGFTKDQARMLDEFPPLGAVPAKKK